MRNLSWFFILAILFITDACIEPISVSVEETGRRMVVDGLVTNGPGPHIVTLRYSQAAVAASKDAIPITGANVYIIENTDNVLQLSERGPGEYVTDANWLAYIGRTYQLKIVTSDGKEFRSTPQQLTAPGTIDNLYIRFERDGIAFGTDGSLTQDAINVFVDATNVEQQPLRWRFFGQFHAKTYPELRIIDSPGGPIPNPPPCSGYINYNGELVRVGECTCCDCYPFDRVSKLSVSETSFTPNHTHREVLVAKIPATPLRFINKYYMEVEQFSVSEEVHSFWTLLKQLQESAGSIFQPNSVKVRGNIRSITSDEEVLGIFAVSGVTKMEMFVDASAFPYPIEPDILAEECDQVFGGATYDKPSFWP